MGHSIVKKKTRRGHRSGRPGEGSRGRFFSKSNQHRKSDEPGPHTTDRYQRLMARARKTGVFLLSGGFQASDILVTRSGWMGRAMHTSTPQGREMQKAIETGQVWDLLVNFKQVAYE